MVDSLVPAEIDVIRRMARKAVQDKSYWFQWTAQHGEPVLVDDAGKEVPTAPRDIVFYVRMQQTGMLRLSVTLQQGLRIELTNEAYRLADLGPPDRPLKVNP